VKSTILLVGTSHWRAPVELRERVALNRQEALALARELAAVADEAICVSTCCRTEVYLSTTASDAAERSVRAALAQRAGLPEVELAPAFYCLRDARAVEHLFRVAAGLDSIVIGELEILGQLKTAVADRQPGPQLERLFSSARRAGRLARRAAGLDGQPASVASAVAAIAERTLGDIGGRRALVIGAGRTGALVTRTLVGRGVEIAYVANRTPARAAQLAAHVDAAPIRLDELTSVLERVDIVVSATASPSLVLDASGASGAGRPLLLFDLAVPRDLDPAIAELPGHTLIDIDGVRLQGRDATAQAERVVRQEARRFIEWHESLAVVPTIVALRAHAEDIRREEVERLRCIDARERALVEAATARVVAKLLHRPTLRLREAAAQTELAAARSLFGLEPSPCQPRPS
jgi:glutamyl-tRNA reductase